jgi:hypothetical protein
LFEYCITMERKILEGIGRTQEVRKKNETNEIT